MRKILGLALLGALVAAVKKYLDTNPDAKRQVKEQAGKAIDQAKHLAEEASGRMKERTGEESADRPLGGVDTATTTPTSTGATVTTPDGPTTGTRTGL